MAHNTETLDYNTIIIADDIDVGNLNSGPTVEGHDNRIHTIEGHDSCIRIYKKVWI